MSQSFRFLNQTLKLNRFWWWGSLGGCVGEGRERKVCTRINQSSSFHCWLSSLNQLGHKLRCAESSAHELTIYVFQTDKLSFCYRGCKTWRYLIFMSFMLTLFMIFVPWYESLKEQAYCMLSMFLSMLTWWLLMFVNAIRPCLESTNHWVGIPNLGMKNGIVPHV